MAKRVHATGYRLNVSRLTSPDTGLLLLAWAAIAFAISRKHGDYTPTALVAVCCALVLAFAACASTFRFPRGVALVVCGALVIDAVVQAGPTNHGHGTWYVLSRLAAVPAAGLAIMSLRWRRAFGPALALLAVTALLRILATPTPPIDVHYLLTDSTRGLLHGVDMYRQSWPGAPATQLHDAYPYLPWTSVLLLPAWLLTHEVRVGLLGAAVVAAYATHRLAGPGTSVDTAFVPLLLIAYPLFPYQLQQSWTEPLLLALLAGMVLAVQRGHPAYAMVAFALALASKQHIALLLPLAACWPAFGWRRALGAAGLAFALVLPWLIAGPRDLWDDAVLLNVHYPVLRRGLDVAAFADRHDLTLGFGVTVAVVALAYAVALLRLPGTAAGFAAGSGLVQLALDVFNKQSFFNHYTLAMGLFVIAVVAARSPTSERGGSPEAGEAGERGVLVDVTL